MTEIPGNSAQTTFIPFIRRPEIVIDLDLWPLYRTSKKQKKVFLYLTSRLFLVQSQSEIVFKGLSPCSQSKNKVIFGQSGYILKEEKSKKIKTRKKYKSLVLSLSGSGTDCKRLVRGQGKLENKLVTQDIRNCGLFRNIFCICNLHFLQSGR